MIFQKNDFILFTGDSITDAGRKRPIGEGLWDGVGNGYVRQTDTLLNTIYPELDLHIANTGCSGNTSRDLLNRLENDVIALQPNYIFLMIGVNDVWRQFDEPTLKNQFVMPDEFKSNLEKIFTEIQTKTKAKLVFLTPYYIESNKKDQMRVRILEYAEIAKKVCAEFHVDVIETQPAFDAYLKYRYPAYLTWDRVHPGPIGSLLLSQLVLKYAGFTRKVI